MTENIGTHALTATSARETLKKVIRILWTLGWSMTLSWPMMMLWM